LPSHSQQEQALFTGGSTLLRVGAISEEEVEAIMEVDSIDVGHARPAVHLDEVVQESSN
jgi:hypothetical protein